MDQLDRLFQRLVHNIRSRNPAHLSLPFTVGELYEQIVPYRHNRRELGIDTNQDYEVTVMRLLSGERNYLLADTAMQEAMTRELESRDPDVGAFREYANTEVSISPEALQQLSPRRATPREGAPQPDAKPAGRPSPADERPAEKKPAISQQESAARPAPPRNARAAAALAAEPPTASGAQATAAGAAAGVVPSTPTPVPAEDRHHDKTQCRFCGTTLPEGREVKFCPNCGQNLAVIRCPACGSEIEAGWRFCITCGREAAT